MVTTLKNTDYAHVRGFNYQPSHASHGLEIWGTDFQPSLMRKELWIGTQHFPGMNTVRLWLSHDAYLRFPDRMPERVGEVLDMGADYDVEFIVTLFNGWSSYPQLGGLHPQSLREWSDGALYREAFEPYVDRILGEYADHEHVLLWDLCNEPLLSVQNRDGLADLEVDRSLVVYRFLEQVYEQVLSHDPTAPTTVGTMGNPVAVELFEPIAEVLSTHPYYAWNRGDTPEGLGETLDEIVGFANAVEKPLLATETGWGALDDEKRAKILDVELSALDDRNIGFTAHLLHNTLVADGHREGYGPIYDAGNMSFVDRDGSLRSHHGVFNDYC
ncbi:cellulase family glycosylhydrolase [Salinarchaeum laminariae]|uniref:cellulase family glycosylhydrolase n=1 Tax=Salinarchaeum laminariae TaxID=869888 RepID=UPI0020BDCBB8|nr:cellulase family glycosylhydrolase [Salinarchaeum laminariae]